MPWGVAASAAASVIGGAIAGGGSSKAGGISQQAIAQADQNRQADRATYQPFVDAGTSGVGMLSNALGLNGADGTAAARSAFTASPGYAYSVDQGLKAVDSGGAAAGMLRSGATLKAEQTLGNNLANADFGNYLTRLNSLSTLGLQGANGQQQTTATFNSLLNQQSTNAEQVAAQNGVNQAGIAMNGIQGVAGGLQNGGWNKLMGAFGSSGGGSGSAGAMQDALGVFGGAGGAVPTY